MASEKKKRSLFAKFLNTGTSAAPTWSIIGDGVVSATINYNPQVTTEQYIHQDSATTEVDSYQPVLPVEASLMVGDSVLDVIDGLRQSRAVLGDAHKELLMVYLYETPVDNQYPAERQEVSVMVDDFGGDGGSPIKVNFTLNFVGDPVLGKYNPTSKTFTPNPNLAALSALTIGSLVLTPEFDRNELWYTSTTSGTTAVIEATPEDESATVVIKLDGVTISDGNLTWLEGLNVVTIGVTVGTETATYTVKVTKTV